MAKSANIFVSCLLLAAASSYEASPADSLLSHWTAFKVQHGKQYASQAEDAKRLELFAKNKLRVDKFNQEQSQEAGYTLAVNHLSDRTDEEFRQLLGFKMTAQQMRQMSGKGLSESLRSILDGDDGDLPDSVDWRTSGRVSSVRDQGQCGSDWAIAAAGVLEGQELPVKQIKKPISLSIQNIMDCGSYLHLPCMVGEMAQALTDVAAQGGVESEQDYPYLDRAGVSCKYNKTLSVIANRGVAALPSTSEQALKAAVAKYGPVAVAINVSWQGYFPYYKSGVYTDKYCHNETIYLDFALLVVGYGTDPQAGDYWIVKNSWSTAWGEEGYIRMARNKNNMCGIATIPVIATF